MSKSLDVYRAKRDFSKTPEPAGKRPPAKSGNAPANAYVIQKHAARRMHYDFRLELNGVLKSWAVPEGPSLIPNKKRLAVHVEDHPLEYGDFEGVIPEGEYGAGTVMVWDKGTWSPEFDPEFGYKKGHLKFRLNGKKLKGVWHLVRMAPKPREKQEAWLLFKSDDEAARPTDAPDILEERPESAATGRDIAEIAADHDRVWSSRQGGEVAQTAKKTRKRGKPAFDASSLPKAKPEKLPKFIEPMLPSAVEKAPSSADWVHEVKYDGYRVQVRIENGKARLLTRQGLDWTERFAGVADVAARLPVKSALIDAEVIVQTEAGVASFTALVDALKSGSGALILYAFDLLHLDGYDLRAAPLKERKAALAKIIAMHGDSRIRYSEHIEGEGEAVFRAAGRLGLEGIVSKRISTPYQSGRTNNWVKVKCTERGEFVIAGFVNSTASKRAIGALVLGEHVGGKLVPSGHVGSGFSASDASSLWQRLDPMRTGTAPLKDETAVAKGAKWVEPNLVAEIEFRGRTGGGLIRHATFREIVEGADPAKVVRKGGTTAKPPAEAAPLVKLTNPGRLEWPDQGITKQGLADFYTEIADWILPHIADRPLSLVRCPGGVQEQCFFQKHKWAGLGDAVRQVTVPGEKEPMLALDSLAGLLELVQASVLEIHPWGAKANKPELPDRVTLDLDPADNVPWQQVIDAALEVRTRLADLGLQSFVKTTGGKGLHVVFPLTPKADWDSVKRFAQSIAERMAADAPRRYTANMAKKVREGRIYVDYLRNGMGATAVAAYSTRARPGAAVSTPLAWDELGPAIRSNHFTVENLPKRLLFLDRDPWEEIGSLRQELPSARTSMRMAKVREPRSAPSSEIQQLLPDAVAPGKDALRAYWKKVAKDALAYLGRRPLRLVRHVDGKVFYHQGRFQRVPEAVHQLPIEKHEGGESIRLWVDSLEGLLGLVDIDVVELHPWGATIDDIERPDGLAFSLEPGDELDWHFLTDTARELRELLKTEGLDSWPKLTGTGVHVMAPIEPDLDWDEAHTYSRNIAERLAATAPDRYVTTPSKATRQGRLYIDWQRNGRGATAIGAYSPRALPGFPVVAPVSWRELERGIRPDAFTMQKPPKLRPKA